jgi:hypothetical protein
MRRINSLLGAAFHASAALGGFTKIFLCILVVLVGAIINEEVYSQVPLLGIFRLEKDRKAPVDYGYGRGAGIGPARPNLVLGQTPAIPQSTPLAPQAVPRAAVPIGGGAGGYFGPAFPWPIIPIHRALLPDGRVLSYGTDETGAQGAQGIYDVWDPKLGNDTGAHTTILSSPTKTDIFCSASSLIGVGLSGPNKLSGKLLITGGDATVNGMRNFSNNNVEIFAPKDNSLAASGTTMKFARWYPSITSLRNGDKLLLGGSVSPDVGEPTPEVYHPRSGWRTLSGITGTQISDNGEWPYPRGFVGFDGAVYLLQHNVKIFRLTTDGAGMMNDTGSLMAPGGWNYPSAMFTPFKMLTVRAGKRAQVVDISSYPPVVTDVAPINYDRIWGNLTLLPDGRFLATGGSNIVNQDESTGAIVAYPAEIFDPNSGTWTLGACPGACAKKPRLYHSGALLLPDGSVLTGGGGAPGPVNQLNAEIYYPSYLYAKDGSGNPAPRPKIVSAPSTLRLGQTFSVTVGSNDLIGSVNLVRVGSNTHSLDSEQRLIPVPVSQSGTTITGTMASAPEKIPPGYYMLFVFNEAGVPAMAKIISVPGN